MEAKINDEILNQEKKHLDFTSVKLQNAEELLQKAVKNLGGDNLERLVELRENPEKGLDFEIFIEQLHEKNQTINIKDKFRQLEELGYLIKEPYFARLDLFNKVDNTNQTIYIGKFGYTEEQPLITDWRAKIASVFYKYRYPQKNVTYDTPGGLETRDLLLKRTFEIDESTLVKYYNNDIQFDESEIVIKKIQERTGGVLEDIVETIQQDQMEIIESDPRKLCIVQGCVGSGKSTVAIHKLSHIFFNFPQFIKPERSILVAKNQILVGYLSTLFPKLGIFNLNYKTLRDLLVNVLFREETNVKFNMDEGQDTKDFTIEMVGQFNEYIQSIHHDVKTKLDLIFTDPVFSTYGSFRYSYTLTPYENVREIMDDIQEELASQIEFIKENPKSLKALFAKDNIKNLRKLIRNLDKIRLDLKNSYLRAVLKKYRISLDVPLNYYNVLIYLAIYTRVIGFSKYVPYEYCVIDEGQDFSLLEYLILGKLVMRGRMAIFGDLNQAIETDGISEWKELEEVVSEAKDAKQYKLETNYRSTAQIIEYANSILGKFTDKYLPKSINRIGEVPETKEFTTLEDLIATLSTRVVKEISESHKTIGIIINTDIPLATISSQLLKAGIESDNLHLLDESQQLVYKPKGVYLMDIANCKGLEFSNVYIINLHIDNVKTALQAKRAFVASTRAMNKLSVYNVVPSKS